MKLGGRTLQPATQRVHTAHSLSDARWIYLTTEDACAFLNYTGRWKLRSLYRFIAANGIRKYYRSTRCVLLRLADLQAVLSRGGRSHAQQYSPVSSQPEASER